MELYDEQVEQKKSKTPMIIGIFIGILVVLTILVVVGIIYFKSLIVTVQVNAVKNNEIQKLFYIETQQDGSKELYLPIIEISKHLGYEGFNGDYKIKSEDKTKCHVKDINNNETAMFTKNSDILIKVSKDSEIEYITLDKPVLEKDGKLYTTIEGVQKAFNVSFSTDKDFKNIKIYSMDYLITYWTTKLNIEKYSKNFGDKKAIFENMIIVGENKIYGVINPATKEYILESKYEEIKYLPATTDFIVKSNGKYGVVTKDRKIKINTVYDEIKIIDNQKGLYLVKQNNAYGVVNTEGQVVIEPEYKQIGVKIDKYAQNGVDNQYILLDEVVPIKNSEDLWALFNIRGEKITEFKYTDIGCTLTPVSNSYPALVISSYKIIVVKNDKYYNLVTTGGEELVPGNIVDSVYLKSDATTQQNKFFMTSSNNTKVLNIEEWLVSIGK